MTQRTAVYVISRGAEGPCKIGLSGDPDRRLAMLQTASPDRLKGEATFWFRTRAAAKRIEAALHDVFEPQRLSGEWFAYRPDMLLGQVESYLDYWGAG